jgi:hypothetical protein
MNSTPELRKYNRKEMKPSNGQSVWNRVRWAPNTYYDKGLFDNREVGYIY